MSLNVTATTQAYLNSKNIQPNIVVEIAGFPYIFGAQTVFKKVKIGEFVIGDGTKIGGTIEDTSAKDLISFNGTTNNISQQIRIDSSEGSSVSSFKVVLIDKNAELTEMFSPGFTVADPLGLEARVYWMPAGTSFPNDAVTLFIGIIDRIDMKQGSIAINIAHPDQLKRQDILPKATAKLGSPLMIGDTTIPVATTVGFYPPSDALESYVRIDDEIIKYDTIDATNFLSCTRGQLGTIEADHDAGADIESFYIINGKPFDLALKILLSAGEPTFATEPCPRFVTLDGATSVNKSIFFQEYDIEERLGLTVGDLIEVSGATNPANNLSSTITGFGLCSLGSYITIADDLVAETDSLAVCTFTSQYNTINFGCGLKPYQVDIKQFNDLDLLVGANHPDLSVYVKDTISASDFFDKELFFPFGIYSVPRKGRISCNVTVPPIAVSDTVVLNEDNILNASSLSITRTTNERFYNAVVYKFNPDSIDDRFLAATITQSSNSTNRIKVGNKYLTIESNGLWDDTPTRNLINVQARRFLDRYQFGAESLDIECTFGDGFRIEVGDTVILDAANIKLSDSKSGSKDFATRVMEVTNKSINLKTGAIKLQITDTGYSSNARYGTWAPSSIVDVDSTGSLINLKTSYATNPLTQESTKWSDYVNQKIIVRSEDWATVYETTLVEVVSTKYNQIRVSPSITAPTEGMIIDVPNYDESSTRNLRFWKALHCFWNQQDQATGGTSSTLTVADDSIYSVGSQIRVHLPDYSEDAERTVSAVNSGTITVSQDFGFTVTSDHLVENLKFGDGGNYYAFF